MMSSNTICKRVIYAGRVQGVGFRYTTHQLAGGFAVGGYVWNLPNGNVELLAEGVADQVDGFLAAVEQRMRDYIANQSVQEEAGQGFQEFTIRY
jgi:acylphosphatase